MKPWHQLHDPPGALTMSWHWLWRGDRNSCAQNPVKILVEGGERWSPLFLKTFFFKLLFSFYFVLNTANIHRQGPKQSHCGAVCLLWFNHFLNHLSTDGSQESNKLQLFGCHRANGGVHPAQLTSPPQGRQPFTLTPMGREFRVTT